MPLINVICHYYTIIIKILLFTRTFLSKTFSASVIFLFDKFIKSEFWYMKGSNAPIKSICSRIVEIIIEECLLLQVKTGISFDLLFFLFAHWWDFKIFIDLSYYFEILFLTSFGNFSIWILLFILYSN